MAEQTIKDVKKEIYLVMHKAQEMLELTEDGFMKNKMASLDEADELAKEIHEKEDLLTATLAKMASTNEEARAHSDRPRSCGKNRNKHQTHQREQPEPASRKGCCSAIRR